METDKNSGSGKQGATTVQPSPDEERVLEVLKNKPLFLYQIAQLVNLDEFRVFETLISLGKKRLVSVDLSAIIYPQPISTALWVYGTKCRPIEELNEINKSAHEGRGFLEEGEQ